MMKLNYQTPLSMIACLAFSLAVPAQAETRFYSDREQGGVRVSTYSDGYSSRGNYYHNERVHPAYARHHSRYWVPGHYARRHGHRYWIAGHYVRRHSVSVRVVY